MRPMAGLLFVVGLLACDGSGASSPATSATASTGGMATPTALGPSAPSASTVAPSDASLDPAAIAVDPDLLGYLPLAVGGSPLVPDPTAAGRIAADASLGDSVSAIAVALVVVASGEEGDLAIASVVRLRPGVFSDAFFADWRASYDLAACEPAGGATGEVPRTISGFDAYVGTCAGGVSTYHVHRANDGILVSITSVGTLQLGALVVAGLR